jgi:hypothetical protein
MVENQSLPSPTNLPALFPSHTLRRSKKVKPSLPDCNKKLIFLSHRVLEMVKVSTVTTGNQIAKSIINDMVGKRSGYHDIDFKNI